ncbi:hypothetical protein [Oceanicola sp. 22II-s10i]|uniref:WYL domain-containing protein n=1 Tax=Oceanicola sp. 22II-s10i TaxID=1317116 RepID=UPI000B520530|nr:hypothetical protein [Oceanicola sp. 22II-s10i]
MRLLDWLYSRASHSGSTVPPPPVVTTRIDVHPPSEGSFDDDELLDDDDLDEDIFIPDPDTLTKEELPAWRHAVLNNANAAPRTQLAATTRTEKAQPSAEVIADLEDVYVMIDYLDARGQASRRRITMRKLVAGSHGPIVRAICHERKALRSFRYDRIQCFIDCADGEVTSPDIFLREVLLINLLEVTPSDRPQTHIGDHAAGSDKLTLIGAREMRERLRAPLSMLVLAATSDGHFHPEELDVICRWIEDEVDDMVMQGAVGLAEIDAMTSLVAKMHPTRASLTTHLMNVRRMDSIRFRRLAKALRDVIVADGALHIDEARFYAEIGDLQTDNIVDLIAEARMRNFH